MKFTSTTAVIAAVATGAAAYGGMPFGLEDLSGLTNCSKPFTSFANCTLEDLENRTTVTKETKKTPFGFNVTITKMKIAPSNGTVCDDQREGLGVCLADAMNCGDEFKAVLKCESEKYSQGDEAEMEFEDSNSNSTESEEEDEDIPPYMMNPHLIYLEDPCRDVKMNMYKCLMEQVEEDINDAEEAREAAIEAHTVLATALSVIDNIGYKAIQVNGSAAPTTEESQINNETLTINNELENYFPSLEMDGSDEDGFFDQIQSDMDYMEEQAEDALDGEDQDNQDDDDDQNSEDAN